MNNKEKREIIRLQQQKIKTGLNLLDQMIEKAEQEDREGWMSFHLKALKELALSFSRWHCCEPDVKTAGNLLDQIIEKAEQEDRAHKATALKSHKASLTAGESWMLFHLKALRQMTRRRHPRRSERVIKPISNQ